MTLKELMRVLPTYVTVHVHDKGGIFAHKGTPGQFVIGPHKDLGDKEVHIAIPLDSYRLEVTVKEVNT